MISEVPVSKSAVGFDWYHRLILWLINDKFGPPWNIPCFLVHFNSNRGYTLFKKTWKWHWVFTQVIDHRNWMVVFPMGIYIIRLLHTMKLALAGHWKEVALSHFNIVFTFEMWNQHSYIVNGKHKGNKLMLETNFLKWKTIGKCI